MSAAPQSTAPPPQPPVRSTEHDFKFHIWLSPKVLQWIPLGAMVIIFGLFVFTWEWLGYHNMSLASENGFQVMIGGMSVDPDFKREKSKDKGSSEKDEIQEIYENGPGWGILTILYFVFGVLLGLTVCALVAVVSILPIQLPPTVQPFLAWRWAVVAAVLLLGLMLWSLQLFLGFNLETRLVTEYNRKEDKELKRFEEFSKQFNDEQRAMSKKNIERGRNAFLALIHRTAVTTWIFWLQLLALLFALLLFVIDFRKTAAIPRIDVLW
jgi:hypothetical protein